MYGSTKVVRALADFEKGGSVLDTDDSLERFLEICQEIRLQTSAKLEALRLKS
jgi:hypothetical protein